MKFTIEGSKQEIESVLEEIFSKKSKAETSEDSNIPAHMVVWSGSTDVKGYSDYSKLHAVGGGYVGTVCEGTPTTYAGEGLHAEGTYSRTVWEGTPTVCMGRETIHMGKSTC